MQDLTPVGLSKDGKKLVLVSSAGEEFSVPLDHRLRTALRGDTARLGQLEMKMESALRPRDIQNRIRSGDTPESVAAAAQTTVEAIMPYAGPVLAERQHVAQSAMSSSVRRKTSDGPSPHRTLDDASSSYFSDLGVRAEEIEWDAWRRDDGRWTLVAHYGVGQAPREARFTYDMRGRYVVADNDEARVLTGEKSAPAPKERSGATGRRLSSVPSDDELPLGDGELGDDAIELVRDEPEIEVDRADADWIASTVPPEQDAAPDAPQDDVEHEDETGHADAEPASESKPAKKKGRSSVPSWDEIMFGGGKGE